MIYHQHIMTIVPRVWMTAPAFSQNWRTLVHSVQQSVVSIRQQLILLVNVSALHQPPSPSPPAVSCSLTYPGLMDPCMCAVLCCAVLCWEGGGLLSPWVGRPGTARLDTHGQHQT